MANLKISESTINDVKGLFDDDITNIMLEFDIK